MKTTSKKEINRFLKENNITINAMNAMWSYMYDKNPIVKNLTDNDCNWMNLNTIAMKSLITQYNKQELPEGFKLFEWYEGYKIAHKLTH